MSERVYFAIDPLFLILGDGELYRDITELRHPHEPVIVRILQEMTAEERDATLRRASLLAEAANVVQAAGRVLQGAKA